MAILGKRIKTLGTVWYQTNNAFTMPNVRVSWEFERTCSNTVPEGGLCCSQITTVLNGEADNSCVKSSMVANMRPSCSADAGIFDGRLLYWTWYF